MPDIEGVPYETTGTPLDVATAQALAARHREAAAAGVRAETAVTTAQARADAAYALADAAATPAMVDQKVSTATTGLVTEAKLAQALEGVKPSGSGVQETSGTVTLDATGPQFVEVYAVGPSTVQGEFLNVGEAAVFRRLAGAWQVMALSASGSPKDLAWRTPGAPDTREVVTATAPTWNLDAANGGGTWTTPIITGVAYSPSSGTATKGQSVTVTATVTDATKYRLDGITSWTQVFPTGPTPLEITHTFAGADGTPLSDVATTTGGATIKATSGELSDGQGVYFINATSAEPFVHTGAGSVRKPATGTVGGLYLDLPTNKIDTTITLQNLSQATSGVGIVRLGIGASRTSNVMLSLSRQNGNVELLVANNASWSTKGSAAYTGDTVTMRLKYDGTTVSGWVNGTLIATAPAAGILGKRLGATVTGFSADTSGVINGLTVKDA